MTLLITACRKLVIELSKISSDMRCNNYNKYLLLYCLTGCNVIMIISLPIYIPIT